MQTKFLPLFFTLSLVLTGCGLQTQQIGTIPGMTSTYSDTDAITDARDMLEQQQEKMTQPASDATSSSVQIASSSTQVLSNADKNNTKQENKQMDIAMLYSVTDNQNIGLNTEMEFYSAGLNSDIKVLINPALANVVQAAEDSEFYLFNPVYTPGSEAPDMVSQLVNRDITDEVTKTISLVMTDYAGPAYVEDYPEIANALHSINTLAPVSGLQYTLEILNSQYPDAYKAVSDELLSYSNGAGFEPSSQEWFDAVMEQKNELYSNSNFLTAIELYDTAGEYQGTFDTDTVNDMDILVQHTINKMESVVKELKINIQQDIMLSELNEGTVYRLSSARPRAQFSYTLINDLGKDVVYTVKLPDGRTELYYQSSDSLDKESSGIVSSDESVETDVRWYSVPDGTNVTDYTQDGEVVCISALTKNKQAPYPKGAKFVYNDTDKSIIINATQQDKTILNPVTYSQELLPYRTVSLSDESANTIYYN